MRVTIIGAGGIGAPLLLALGEAGVREVTLVDDDVVELSNLHRQLLFGDEDVGRHKLVAVERALAARFPGMAVTPRPGRALPSTVLELVADARVVVDATDNFASRFLLADACRLAGVPVVHAAAVRWQATVMAVGPDGGPCYRCLFEDLPSGPTLDCATAGVMAPLCGIAGAIAADSVLGILEGAPVVGRIITFDGRRDRLRSVAVARRADCPLCGDAPTIGSIEPSRYMRNACDSL